MSAAPPGEPGPDPARGPRAAGDDERALVAWLAGHDEPCPVCSFNLRGVPGARCPECGSGLSLAVASVNTRLGPWILALVSCAMALGFDAVVLVLLTIAVILSGPPASAAPIIVFYYLVFLVLGGGSLAGLIWLVAHRRSWHRMEVHRHWPAAIGVFVGIGIIHALAGLFIFAVIA